MLRPRWGERRSTLKSFTDCSTGAGRCYGPRIRRGSSRSGCWCAHMQEAGHRDIEAIPEELNLYFRWSTVEEDVREVFESVCFARTVRRAGWYPER